MLGIRIATMQVIPSLIQKNLEEGVTSRAERKVFESLSNINVGQHCLSYHSLNLPDHAYKFLAELDFVIVSALGVLVLEVKGEGGGLRRTG